MLRSAIEAIHKRSSSNLAYEQLYRAAYRIVLKKNGGQLHTDVKDLESKWFESNVVPRLWELCSANLVEVVCRKTATSYERRRMGEGFLRGLRDAWIDHNVSMNMVADVLMYLDKQYLHERKLPSIFTTTIGLFRDRMLRIMYNDSNDSILVQDILNSVLLDQIEMERNGEVVDRSLLKSIVGMLDGLYETDEEKESEKLYFTVFEPVFLTATSQFYSQECQKLLAEADVATWLTTTLKRINEEQRRCAAALHGESRDKVIQIIEQKMILAHLDEFLNAATGLRWMIDNEKIESLALLYALNKRVDKSLASMKRILQNHAVEAGRETHKTIQETDFSVPPPSGQGDGENGEGEGGKAKPLSASAQQTAAAIKWVDDILSLKDKFDGMWKDAFQSDTILESALARSYSDVINSFDRASEYVSLFVDDLLRRGIRNRSESEVTSTINKAIVLIRYLQDKDMFERYYQKHLARRLLNAKSESHEVEKDIIASMKQEFGTQFTSKFEGMFRDMETSNELTRRYRDHIRAVDDSDSRIDLTVNILTTNSWPPEIMGKVSSLGNSSPTQCLYPPEIDKLHASVKAFYLKDRNGRKLTWVGQLGTADIKCSFPAIPGKSGPLSKERRYEINVSTYGMVVLMLFNSVGDEALSFKEIQAKTSIPESDLVKALHSLTIPPKSKLLLKEPVSKLVHPTDTFVFNKAFVSKTMKIKVPTVAATSKVEAAEERKATEQKTDQARAIVMDAAIVRIMK